MTVRLGHRRTPHGRMYVTRRLFNSKLMILGSKVKGQRHRRKPAYFRSVAKPMKKSLHHCQY